MTDKQIIIDGIDVSGCPHIEYEYKWWNMAGHERNSENVCALYFDKNADFEEDFLCLDNPNCYYKQLLRKEQECEELKETFDGLLKVQYKLADNCKKLRQCLTEIKEIARVGAFYWKHYKEESKRYNEILQKISECEGGNEF